MTSTWLPWALVALMFLASALAFIQTPESARLPMQWGIRGQVNWRAPRAVAFLFTPLLAVIVLGLMVLLAGRQRDELGLLPVFVASVFVITHGIYLFFALRDVEASRQEGQR